MRGLPYLPRLKAKIDPIAIPVIFIGSAALLALGIKCGLFQFWFGFLQGSPFLKALSYPLIISLVISLVGLIVQTVLWLMYKPHVRKGREKVDWPSVSVVICAYNEEGMVGGAIRSVIASYYPSEKLEVVCVNDGSTDGTARELQEAARNCGPKLKVIDFARNKGKRRAFYEGFRASHGEVVVSLDADSRLDRSAIRHIVLPLIRDGETAAVAGRVAVLNEKANLLTRMLAVRYALAFDFGRGYQSVYGGVVCCPGALAAYRREFLAKVIRKWLYQRFMGRRATHGEDRALTTLAMKSGHMVRYQSNAVVYTKAPTRIGEMNRMYLRWSRSSVRESVEFSRFMFRRYRPRHRVLPALDFLFTNALFPLHALFAGAVVYSFVASPLYIVRHLALLVAGSFVLSLYYLRTERSWAFLYGIPYAVASFFLLWWLVPYSALTVRNQSWLTR
jgi:hyaluronan synthase